MWGRDLGMWEGPQWVGGASPSAWSVPGTYFTVQVLSNVFSCSSSWAGRNTFAVWGHVTDLRSMECGIIDVCHFQAGSVTISPMRWSSCPRAVR